MARRSERHLHDADATRAIDWLMTQVLGAIERDEHVACVTSVP
ncbi:hypothetical protein [Mycolicibacterium pulveris]